MRYHGTIMRWDYELGFGFIKEEQTKSEIFAHIGEFETENPPPRDGETVSFDIVSNSHGTEEAKNIEYTNRRRKPVAVEWETEADSPKNLSLWLKGMVAALVGIPLLGAAGYYGLSYWQDSRPRSSTGAVMVDEVADKMMAEREAWRKAVESTGSQRTASPFRCDGRTYCSQMKSFAEAQHFLAYCPDVKMDGDNDGIPCEEQFAAEIRLAGLDNGDGNNKDSGGLGAKLSGLFSGGEDSEGGKSGIWSHGSKKK